MTHEELCTRARVWLRGTKRCKPVFSNCASCAEIPDAIGWASRWESHGSIVVECKTSVSDFYADKKKRIAFKDPKFPTLLHSGKIISTKIAAASGYEQIELPLMGDFRFYLCEAGIISAALVEEHAPDHGLLFVKGRIVSVIRQAPRREKVDWQSEIRFLRFAIINKKNSHHEVPR